MQLRPMNPIFLPSFRYLDKPFDPSTLKVEVRNSTVGKLCDLMKRNGVDLRPDSQRYGKMWPLHKQSRLIESLFLGLPLSSFYFLIDNDREQWVVIDGLQRLYCLKSFFLDKTLRLSGLEFLKARYDGKGYDDLTYFERLNLSMQSVTLNIMSGNAAEEAKFVIFERIHSETTKLSPAEIRNALIHGKVMSLVKELAHSDAFKKATSGEVKSERMIDQDYVSRFLAFFVAGYQTYKGNMNEFVFKVLNSLNDELDNVVSQQIKDIFYAALATSSELLGPMCFRQPQLPGAGENAHVTNGKVLISLFEVTMCALSDLSDKERGVLLDKKDAFRRCYRQLFKNEDLTKSLLNGTNYRKQVLLRFSEMEKLVRGNLEK